MAVGFWTENDDRTSVTAETQRSRQNPQPSSSVPLGDLGVAQRQLGLEVPLQDKATASHAMPGAATRGRAQHRVPRASLEAGAALTPAKKLRRRWMRRVAVAILAAMKDREAQGMPGARGVRWVSRDLVGI